MEEIKLILKNVGCTKDEIEVAVQAITNINGDHIQIYRQINSLCKASDDLAHTKSLIKQLGFTDEQKTPYVRKSRSKQSLLEKSGAKEPSAAVIAVDELLGERGRQALGITTGPVKKPKRRKESDIEIRANIEGMKDEPTGAQRLSPEEAANNLTIDL